MNIAIIAGGCSAAAVNLANLCDRMHVIGVNDAAVYAPVHEVVTMDRLWLENRYEQLVASALPAHFRSGTAKCVDPQPPQFIAYTNNNSLDAGMSKERGHLNGSNSGAVAMNLAYQKLASFSPCLPNHKVYLIGFDFKLGPGKQKHWYPDHPWKTSTKPAKLDEWGRSMAPWACQFIEAGIEPYLVEGEHSYMRGPFRRITAAEFHKHLARL